MELRVGDLIEMDNPWMNADGERGRRMMVMRVWERVKDGTIITVYIPDGRFTGVPPVYDIKLGGRRGLPRPSGRSSVMGYWMRDGLERVVKLS